jgi:mannose-6-phosphate isomerase-like protein (cupin superfamily)
MVTLGPGEGERRTARGSTMVFKATSATTGGRFSLMERHLPAGGPMPPAHRHVGCLEAFFVLEGEVTFVLDGHRQTRGTGSFVLVAQGGSHTFGNRGPEPASLLVLHSPAMDAYFDDLELLWSRREAPSGEEELALMARHGMEPA